MTDAAHELLARVDLFQGVSRSELRAVLGLAKTLEFAPGEPVTEEGTAGGRFHLITRGRARVSVKGRTRSELGPGDYFGEMSLLDGGPRSATVRASEPLTTLSIAEWNFRPLLKSHPTIAYKMLVMMCRRLRSVERNVTG